MNNEHMNNISMKESENVNLDETLKGLKKS